MELPPPPGLRVVGLLGGVGAGKSTAARALAAALEATGKPPGSILARVLDADAEVARLLARPDTVAALEERLGPGLRLVDGSLDRRALGRRIFGDAGARRIVEELLHPAVRRSLHRQLDALEASGRPAWAILDVPLLLEGGLLALCDRVLFVDAPAAARAARARARHGWSQEEWQAREAAQASLAEKRRLADAILDNGGDSARLSTAVQALLPGLLALPPRPLRERWPDRDRPPRPPAAN